MRILLAGDWRSNIHEQSASQALQVLGHDVIAFPWHQYFRRSSFGTELLGRAQNKYLVGPSVDRLNRDLVRLFRASSPDVVFIYRGTHVYPESLTEMKQRSPGSIIVGYNNDDPFSPMYPQWAWRHFRAGIPFYDVLFAYRPSNMEELKKAGAQAVHILPPWFTNALHHPLELHPSERDEYESDVCFIGHFEADERVEYMRELSRTGITLRIWGPTEGWASALRGIPELRNQLPVVPLHGPDYVRALCSSKVALAFFSKLNRDVYTRRSVEIPATGTFMLSTYSPQVGEMFRENEEAVFFRSAEELVSKAQYYLEHPVERRRIAYRGYKRVHLDGHESINRMRQMVQVLENRWS